MDNYTHSQFQLSGYKISTTNKDRQSGQDIMEAWRKFREEKLGDKVVGKSNETVHCVYYNYQNADSVDKRSYDMLIGFETGDEVLQTDPEITTITV